ncbi:MAG: ligase-associated DNA damage response endonuclease PdeM [Planctomycetaceae bacterium]
MQIAVAASPAAAATTPGDVVLVPGRAAYLPATRTLLVADVHLGKAATFRAAGMPVPEGSAQADLARLVRLVAETTAARLIVLGDLFHAKRGATEQVFAEFTAARAAFASTEVLLVAGNHDRSVGALPPSLGIDSVMRTHDEPPFHFVHDPATELSETWRKAEFTIGGHLHPTVSISAPGGERVAERCFVAEQGVLVLPAFGSFTGGHRVEPGPGVRLWIARDDGVADVTRLANLAAEAQR